MCNHTCDRFRLAIAQTVLDLNKPQGWCSLALSLSERHTISIQYFGDVAWWGPRPVAEKNTVWSHLMWMWLYIKFIFRLKFTLLSCLKKWYLAHCSHSLVIVSFHIQSNGEEITYYPLLWIFQFYCLSYLKTGFCVRIFLILSVYFYSTVFKFEDRRLNGVF